MRSLIRVVALAVSALFIAQPVFAADDLDPASTKAMHDYVLSMDKVSGMQAAMDEAQKNAALVKGMKSVGDDSKSIAEMEAKLNAMPQAMALYRKHGLSAHDVVVMPFVLMYAGMAVAYPSSAAKLAQYTSPAQIAFYKQHQADLKKVKWLSGN
jgi:hypothetical protein